MEKLMKQMDIYQKYHTKKLTKLSHVIGVPCIILAIQILLILFSHKVIGSTILSWIILSALMIYYFLFDIYLGLLTNFVLISLMCLAQFLLYSDYAFILSINLFTLGWILQFLGHYYEGNKPAFFVNFLQMFIAPIFLMAEFVLLIKS